MNDLRMKSLIIALAAAGPAACVGTGSGSNADPDNNCARINFYLDADGDGFGDVNNFVLACAGSAPPGYVPNYDDCDDTRADVSPNATEICDGIDANCDGVVDDGYACGEPADGCTHAGDSADGHHYIVCTGSRTRAGAELGCESLNGHLADLSDATEDALVSGLYRETFGTTHAWIYPFVTDTALAWSCLFGSDGGCGYTNWDSTPSPVANECAVLGASGGLVSWFADDCTLFQPYICEIASPPAQN